MAEPMTLIEWRKFFLKAKEGTTTSVISGLHRGNYKTCATNDIIATMQMTIVSLAFEFGLKEYTVGIVPSITSWKKGRALCWASFVPLNSWNVI